MNTMKVIINCVHKEVEVKTRLIQQTKIELYWGMQIDEHNLNMSKGSAPQSGCTSLLTTL